MDQEIYSEKKDSTTPDTSSVNVQPSVSQPQAPVTPPSVLPPQPSVVPESPLSTQLTVLPGTSAPSSEVVVPPVQEIHDAPKEDDTSVPQMTSTPEPLPELPVATPVVDSLVQTPIIPEPPVSSPIPDKPVELSSETGLPVDQSFPPMQSPIEDTNIPQPSVNTPPIETPEVPQSQDTPPVTDIFQPTNPLPETQSFPVVPLTPEPIAQDRQNVPVQSFVPSPSPMPETSYTASPVSTPPPPPSDNKGLLRRIGMIVAGVGILIIVLIIVLAILPKRSGSQKISLTYWGLWENKNIMNSVIQDFQRKYPNIEINYVKQDPDHYSDRLLARIPDGTGPDIYRFHNSWVPLLKNDLLPLSTDVITKEDFTKNYYPVIQHDVSIDGALYGLPLEIDTLALFVNENIFKATGTKVPQTWAEFKDAAPALTVKNADRKIKTAGASMGTYDNIKHAPDIMSVLFLQNGADVYHLQDSQSYAQSALEFYQGFAQGDDSVWDTSLDPSLIAFGKGNLAMYFGYSWDVFDIKAQNPNLNFKVYPVPHLPGRTISLASYWVEGISAKSKHPKEAMLFMKFLAEKETIEKLYTEEAKVRLFGEPYARSDMADKLKDNPYLSVFIGQAPTAQSSFFTGETYDTNFNGKLNGYLGNAIRSAQSNITSDNAIKTLSDGVTQVLGLYGIR